MKFGDYPKAGSLDGVAGFRDYMKTLGLDMPCDDIVAERTGLAAGRPAGIRWMIDRASARRCSRWKAGIASSTAGRRKIPSGAGGASVSAAPS